MAGSCPQGWTDVELPEDVIGTLVKIGHAYWDPEEGVHKLTAEGHSHLNEYLRGGWARERS